MTCFASKLGSVHTNVSVGTIALRDYERILLAATVSDCIAFPGVESHIPNGDQYMYDKKNLKRIKKMNGLAPEVMKAFWAFDQAALAPGAIPAKYNELIAVAVACTTQCPYCIDIHAENARKAGATEAELVEAGMVAAALRAGAAVTHATHLLAD